MSSSANINELARAWFRPIGLKDLNHKAEMLERLDNKYVVSAGDLKIALKAFSQSFDMLEIHGERAFEYDTCYFDDSQVSCYRHHHQGRRNRAKVRMRRYVGTDLCFVEVKLKDKRGVTVKKRLACDPDMFGILDENAIDFINREHSQMYGRPFDLELGRTVEMQYRRMTLVAKDGGERMTIDSALQFRKGDDLCRINPDIFILETKSAKGNGLADAILRAQHLHPTRNCSKYCASVALLFANVKVNRFLPALRKLVQPGSGVALRFASIGGSL